MKRIRKILVLGIAAFSLFGSAVPAFAANEIVLGYVDDLSSLVAEAGNDSLNGFKVAVAEANAAGGVNGRQIKLVVYDGKVDPRLTYSFVTRAIQDDGAIVHMSWLPGKSPSRARDLIFDWTSGFKRLTLAKANRSSLALVPISSGRSILFDFRTLVGSWHPTHNGRIRVVTWM
jgi:hypothetical protein